MMKYPQRRVISDYRKRMDDELDMKAGDKIQVITDDGEYNDGWYYGCNLSTGYKGLFPKNFTEVIGLEVEKKSKRRDKDFDKKIVDSSDNNKKENVPQKHEMVIHTIDDIDKALADLKTESLEILAESSFVNNISSSLQTSNLLNPNSTIMSDNSADFQFPKLAPAQSSQSFNISSTSSLAQDQKSEEHIKDILTVNDWTPKDVRNYFLSKNFDKKLADKFEEHQISGSILIQLELSHLKEMDIASFGHRFEISKEIQKIKEANRKCNAKNIKLRQASGNSVATSIGSKNLKSELLPAASFQQTLHPQTYKYWKNDKVNTRSYKGRHSRQTSSISQDEQFSIIESDKLAEIASDKNIFESPGVAPKPPPFRSPVQPQMSPVANKKLLSSSPIIPQYSYQHDDTGFKSYLNDEKTTVSSYSVDSNSNSRFKYSSLSPHITSTITEEDSSYGLEKRHHDSDIHSANKNDNSGSRSSSAMSSTSTNNSGRNPTTNTIQTAATEISSHSNIKRNSVIYTGHRKSTSGGSFVDLYNRISSMSPGKTKSNEFQIEDDATILARPKSRFYNHSRSSSTYNLSSTKISSPTMDYRQHRRNSSVLSFFSQNKFDPPKVESSPNSPFARSTNTFTHSRKNSSISSPLKQENLEIPLRQKHEVTPKQKNYRHSMHVLDSSKSSVTAESSPTVRTTDAVKLRKKKSNMNTARPISEIPTILTPSKSKVKFNKTPKKKQTSAFLEGIQSVSVKESANTADCSGWMNKKGSGKMGTWKRRFFTLHGTRLSYFSNTESHREKGLIDITGHRVVPVKDEDKLVAMYAANTGKGKYIFKLLPPQPGSRKGLTFTQPQVHYFAVDTKEEMRHWLGALIKASIDIDSSVPIVSSYMMPTVSLEDAKKMLENAKQEMMQREQERLISEIDEDKRMWEETEHTEPQYLGANVL